jgi:multicomponent Na+:H+ antiporter subunit E
VVFFPWLFLEIIKSNIDVAKVILSPSIFLQPQVFTTTARQTTAVGRTIYANSITLTPGTVTIDVRGNEFEVHALTQKSADGIKTGQMDRLVCRMEGKL